MRETTAGAATFAARLVASRRAAGLSQQELAGRAGMSVRALGNLERGRTKWPHPDSVRRLADALHLREAARAEFIAAAERRLAGSAGAPAAADRPDGPARADEAQVIPRQLPAPVHRFAGRREELAALTALLDQAGLDQAGLDQARAGAPAVVISAIGGMAGIGKTALAVHWAHGVAGRFPDGQLYVNLRGFHPSGRPVPPEEAIRGFLDALGAPAMPIPATLEAQVGLYRSLLSGRRMLILLDNARDAEQVRPLLPGSPGCVVVVTSRSRLAGLVVAEDARHLALGLLTDAEAGELLGLRLGAERVEAEPAAVTELVRLCGRLPLALTIVAARVSTDPRLRLGALAAELTDAQRRLDALETGEGATSVRAVFSWSVQGLPAPAARMFALLGLPPGADITIPAAASLAGIPPLGARRALRELAEAHLVTEHAPGRFSLHDLLRAYASEQASPDGGDDLRRAAFGRMLDHYVQTACAAARLLNPAREAPSLPVLAPAPGVRLAHLADAGQALAWYAAEYKTLLAAIEQAVAAGFDAHAYLLSWSLADFLDRRGNWHDWVTAQQAALTAANRLGDRALQARTERGLGRAYTELGALPEARAHFERALGLDRELGHRVGQANTYLAMARVDEYQGRYAQAIGHAQQGLDLLREAGDTAGQARALNGIGWFHAQLGNHREAVNCCAEALDLYRLTKDRRGEATTHDSLGFAYHNLGAYAQAIASYENGLEIHRDLGDRLNQADTFVHLGDSCHALGNSEQARDAWHRALAILDDPDQPVVCSRDHLDAAQVYARLRQLP